ncbi:ATP-binding protein [Actomonas aquatica]|uniref:ATP-binding protein n=1 Tax=Actomonas aquatica TaxID=2866162 RepID=A0ABZ1CCK7_9BACT|nr:ATP-binding protein [Opitutus sp. WL0086]WRQ89380.1 ATP-binding protein [Opitutus sp. WL0086]
MTATAPTAPAKGNTAITAEPPEGRLTIRKDLSQFEARMVQAGYPEEVFEDCLFIYQVNQREFSGKYPLLAHLVRSELRIDRSDAFFYQLLGGKYFRRQKGTGKIQGSRETVKEIADALRTWVVFNSEAGGMAFVETPTWQSVADYIDAKREPTEVCKFGGIVGSTGTGKSRMTKRYALINNHGKTVHLEAPSRGSLSKFQVKLGSCYSVSISAPAQERNVRITECVRADSTIIVDNIQKLYNKLHGPNQPVLNYLQELQDDTGCTIILNWTPVFTEIFREGADQRYFEQFVGRLGGLDTIIELPEFTPLADLKAIAAKMEIAGGKNAIDLMRRWSRQPGRQRILFSRLQRARRFATDEGCDYIKLAHLEAADCIAITPSAEEGAA